LSLVVGVYRTRPSTIQRTLTAQGSRVDIAFSKTWNWGACDFPLADRIRLRRNCLAEFSALLVWLPHLCGCSNYYREERRSNQTSYAIPINATNVSEAGSCSVRPNCMENEREGITAYCDVFTDASLQGLKLGNPAARSFCPRLRAFVGRFHPKYPHALAVARTLLSQRTLQTARIAIGYQTAESYRAMRRWFAPWCVTREGVDKCEGFQPSTGMYAFATFAEACKHLTAYGFAGREENKASATSACARNYSGSECTPLEHRVQRAIEAALPHRVKIVM
jgi:hypothetical protein